MSYTIWHRGVLLGRTDLAMPSPGPKVRVGQLEPAIEFERAWAEVGPVIDEVIAAGAAIGNAFADLPPAADGVDPTARGRQVYEWLSAHPAAGRVRAASEALASLGLELRDPTGRLVTVQTIMVQEVRPPAWVPAAAIAHEVEQARKEGLDVRVPSYIVVIQGVAETPDAG